LRSSSVNSAWSPLRISPRQAVSTVPSGNRMAAPTESGGPPPRRSWTERPIAATAISIIWRSVGRGVWSDNDLFLGSDQQLMFGGFSILSSLLVVFMIPLILSMMLLYVLLIMIHYLILVPILIRMFVLPLAAIVIPSARRGPGR